MVQEDNEESEEVDSAIKTKTVVLGLKKALINHSLADEVTKLVDKMAETKFHASNIIALYANQVAQASTREEALQHVDAKFQRNGEVFNQNFINHAIALVHAGKNKFENNVPPLLLRVTREYFDGPLLNAHKNRPEQALEHTALREEMRNMMKVSYGNCMEISTPLNQRSALRDIYGLSAKEAKLVCEHISTSLDNRKKNATKAHAKIAWRLFYRLRNQLEKATRDGNTKETERLQKEVDAAQRDVNRRTREAIQHPELAEGSLASEFPFTQRSGKDLAGNDLIPLEEIIRREKAFVPEKQTQLDQLRYRWNLLSRCPTRGFNLTPTAKYTRSFVRFTKQSIAKLVAGGVSKKRKLKDEEPISFTTLDAALPLIFTSKALKSAKSQNWLFGASFQTDGVQLQFSMVKPKNVEEARISSEAGMKTKAALKDLYAHDPMICELEDDLDALGKRKREYSDDEFEVFRSGCEYLINEEKAHLSNSFYLARERERAESAKVKEKIPKEVVKKKKPIITIQNFTLPADATLVALDLGVRNVFGCAREDAIKNGWTYSLARYRNDTGQRREQKLMEIALKHKREDDPLFCIASDGVDAASLKTANYSLLLAALQTRGKHFKTLFTFYGSQKRTLSKFLNYIKTNRALDKLVQMVAPFKTDVVVVGDANFQGIKIKGHTAGVAGKFVDHLIKRLGPDRIVYGDEFRSSRLDSQTKTLMFHPPHQPSNKEKAKAEEVDGKLFLKRTFGIYQSSGPGYSRTWNRDVNAAINIVQNFRYLYEHGEMPLEFRRGVVNAVPDSLKRRYKWLQDTNSFERRMTTDEYKGTQL